MIKNEIERRYLLRPVRIEKLCRALKSGCRKEKISQYYLPAKKSAQRVRYRHTDSGCYRTVKSGNGMVRLEEEQIIPETEYFRHKKELTGQEIVKTRYRFEYESREYELDRFENQLKGLWILEIEFDDMQDAQRFALPDIFADLTIGEITEDARFNNSALCSLKFSSMVDISALSAQVKDPSEFFDRLSINFR